MSNKKIRHLKLVKEDKLEQSPAPKNQNGFDILHKYTELFGSALGFSQGLSQQKINNIKMVLKEFLFYSEEMASSQYVNDNIDYLLALNKQMEKI